MGIKEIILHIFVFIFGSIVGSFLNVCIWRMPRSESIIRPGSHCPHCRHPIAWSDNIPFLSFLLLAGKCRHCGARISFRYFLVELITASVFLVFYHIFYYNLSLIPEFFIYSALASALIAATFMDFEHRIIPDEITLGGLAAGIIISLIYPRLHNTQSIFALWPFWRHISYYPKALLFWGVLEGSGSMYQTLWGILAGGGSIYLIGLLGNLIFKKESMGGGDIKLMAMIGAVIGWKMVLLTFFMAPIFGSIVGIILKIKTKAEIIPYGPYLSLATIISILWGEQILKFIFF